MCLAFGLSVKQSEDVTFGSDMSSLHVRSAFIHCELYADVQIYICLPQCLFFATTGGAKVRHFSNSTHCVFTVNN